MDAELFTDRFFPKNFEQFIGNSDIVQKAQKWAEQWNENKKQKPLFFHGVPGNGKTALALLLAEQNNWDVFELNASDLRSKDVIEKLVSAASQSSSFSGKKRLILLDEIDGLQKQDKGGAQAVLKILKESNNPVILTANDVYANQNLAMLRANSELLHFKKINYLSVAKRLRELCRELNVEFEDEAVKELAQNSSGDMRAALFDLQTLSSKKITMQSLNDLGARERNENIFKTIQQIFRAKNFKQVQQARFKSEVDLDMLERWIEENIPREFNSKDTALAFDVFSKADVLNGRVFRHQYYGFKRYSSELMTSGVSLIRENDYHGWAKYQFPQIIKKLGSAKPVRTLKKNICTKIGKQIHSSSKQVLTNELPVLIEFFKDKEKAALLSAQFDFSLQEIAFLMQSKPDTKKVQTVFENSQKIREKKISEQRIQKKEHVPLTKTVKTKKSENSEQKKSKKSSNDSNQTKLF